MEHVGAYDQSLPEGDRLQGETSNTDDKIVEATTIRMITVLIVSRKS